ncbi:uncharacterized protein C8A04DRAFT_37726 [Dichotomopilus funicola]|uniref:Erythromycin biosynthesis protein CIII-like C-terminal domain-containing protein n=1 Tax=Dichotomopilus funicola TaxID=1934379 RepID=A0AAN6V1U2_9PEZI|nr:hypothetical protein C8A04DRAFT_37726 [Dichotomopilus funicola]
MPKILLVTNSEHGQANVFLAVGHGLQALDPTTEVRFASFAPIADAVASASAYSVQTNPGAAPWKFEQLDGVDFMNATNNKEDQNRIGDSIEKRPSFSSVKEILRKLSVLLLPWSGPEFVVVYKSLVRIYEETRPDLVVIDSLFAPALTAARHLGWNHLVFSPNTLKDFAAAHQPKAAVLWKFPMMGSAFEFPVPLKQIPLNIFYVFYQIYHSITDRTIKTAATHIKAETGARLITFTDLLLKPRPDDKVLVSNRPEIEFPLAVIPKHLFPCGPVIRPVPPVKDVDPELDVWLARGPTVFISLGTHRFMKEDEALEMAGAIKQLLDAGDAHKGDIVEGVSGKLQVLWKLKRHRPSEPKLYEVGPGSKVYEVLRPAIEADRLRIVDWVKPEPSAVLMAKTVVCSINHGGANSFHDALTSGVPQVVIPPWLDCYDFATRAEFLGIGRWGSKQAMPRCTTAELGPILVDVVLGPNAKAMRTKVQELAALCGQTPGVEVAAAQLLEAASGKKVDWSSSE